MSADPHDFYTRRVPAQWNRTLEEQRAAAQSGDDAAQRVLSGMQAVDATIRVEVRGDETERFELNVAAGRMSAEETAAHPPFMTLAHDLDAFAVLERESGDSVLGFLGGLAGLEEAMKLTAGRMENLAGLAGTLRFALTGEGGFALLVHFGEGEVADEPKCGLSVARDAYEKLRSGEMNPQEAFMNQQIAIEGDMQMAMQLALAAMTPD
jgi:putative sterol carrier protein